MTIMSLQKIQISSLLLMLLLLLSANNKVMALSQPDSNFSPMSEQQYRGQQIYLTGISPSGGEINAKLNQSGATVPGSIMPCVNCHQYNGIGIEEGGITPADIRWLTLSKPYGIAQEDGDNHPAYSLKSLKRAIAMGIDSGGDSIHQIMPRYQLSINDMNDLLAYIQGLGQYQPPGVSDTQLRIGVILPAEQKTAASIKALVEAYYDNINQQGGIFARQVTLVFVKANHPKLAQQLQQAKAFAFVASSINGVEQIVANFAKRYATPVLVANSNQPALSFPLNRYMFYMLSGQNQQTQVLRQFANNPDSRQAWLIARQYSDIAKLKPQQQPLFNLHSDSDLEQIINQLKQQNIDTVHLALASEQIPNFLHQAAKQDFYPQVLIAGSQIEQPLLAGQYYQLPKAFDRKLFIALSLLPIDHQSKGVKQFQKLKQQYQLQANKIKEQLVALASINVLAKGLTDSGRNLKQAKLVANLESLYLFNTQLTRPISFGPNQRVGSLGAYVVTVDLNAQTIRAVSKWLKVY